MQVEGSILALLEQHGALAAEQVAAHLNQPTDAVQTALWGLHERGLVDVFGVGDLKDNFTRAVAYWRLTDDGRAELARLRRLE